MDEMLEYIKELAYTIRETLELDNKDVITEDCLKKLLKSIGGKISYKKFERDIEGQIDKDGKDKFHIMINKDIASEQRCLKIAEEIGHLFLHMGFIIDEEQWRETNSYIDSVYHRIGYSKEAYEANYFARLLLQSKTQFQENYNNHCDSCLDTCKR